MAVPLQLFFCNRDKILTVDTIVDAALANEAKDDTETFDSEEEAEEPRRTGSETRRGSIIMIVVSELTLGAVEYSAAGAAAGAEPDAAPGDSMAAIADAGLAGAAAAAAAEGCGLSAGAAAAVDDGDEGGGARFKLMPTLEQSEEANSSAAISKSVKKSKMV